MVIMVVRTLEAMRALYGQLGWGRKDVKGRGSV